MERDSPDPYQHFLPSFQTPLPKLENDEQSDYFAPKSQRSLEAGTKESSINEKRRLAGQRSREKKKSYLKSLEDEVRRLAEEVQQCESEISECKDKLVEALKKSPSVTRKLCRAQTSIPTHSLSWRGRPSPKIRTSTGSICLLILFGYLIINAESHRRGGDGEAGEPELQLQANRQFHVSGTLSLLSQYRIALLALLCSQKQPVRSVGHVDCLNFSEDES